MKAVDIVLLMPDNINQQMIEMNRSLDNSNRVIDFEQEMVVIHIISDNVCHSSAVVVAIAKEICVANR